MNDWSALEAFLHADPADVGCERALDLLHVYAELVATGAIGEAQRRYPGVAAHLLACGPCGEDYAGLLAALRTETP